MPMSLADANADVADLNSDLFRYDHWFVAGAQSAGECRHGQKWNNKNGK
jgi:biotin-(acetyl-CoA carboxylase) ligase